MPNPLLLCLESGSQSSKKGICGVAGFESAVCFVCYGNTLRGEGIPVIYLPSPVWSRDVSGWTYKCELSRCHMEGSLGMRLMLHCFHLVQ